MIKGFLKRIIQLMNPYLEHRIKVEIEGLAIEDVVGSSANQASKLYQQVNNETVIYNYTAATSRYRYPLYFVVLILSFFLFLFIVTQEEVFSLETKIFLSVPWIVLVASLYYRLFGYKKVIVLDRHNGCITFPRALWQAHHTIPFEQAKAYITKNRSMAQLAIKDVKTNKYSLPLSSHLRNINATWSFYVWYMDRHRPLPPGTAFDPFREQDFQRRKAEGFPAPLYPCDFITPEATPEQQNEADQYQKEKSFINTVTTEKTVTPLNPDIYAFSKAIRQLNAESRGYSPL